MFQATIPRHKYASKYDIREGKSVAWDGYKSWARRFPKLPVNSISFRESELSMFIYISSLYSHIVERGILNRSISVRFIPII